MALTSYTYRGVELNDGLAYATPSIGLSLDDQNPVDESFIYRTGGEPPLSGGITVKESTIAFNINIIATNATDFENRLATLARIFETRDPTYYALGRKLPHEASYKTIEVSARQFTVNRVERKVSITLNCRDRRWKNATWIEQSWTLFTSGVRDHTLTLNYDGKIPFEPIVELTPLTVGSDGPVPLYYNDVTVYTAGPNHVLNTPILIASGWNTNTQVGAGHMRADGLDISVNLLNGTPLKRVVAGTQASRRIWILPQVWPDAGGVLQVTAAPTAAGLTSTTIPVTLVSGQWNLLPTSGKISINNEILAFTGLQYTTGNNFGMLTGVTRAQDGTSSQDLTVAGWSFVKFPVPLRIAYGYSAAYNTTYFQNDLTDWPLINYSSSDNATWIQDTENTTLRDSSFRARPFSWLPSLFWPATPNEVVRAGYTGDYGARTAKATLGGNKLGASQTSFRERLLLTLYGPNSRRVTQARFFFDLSAGDGGQFPTTTIEIDRTHGNFAEGYTFDSVGNPVTYEMFRSMYTASRASGSASYDTGWLDVLQSETWGALTHLFIWMPVAPTVNTPNASNPATRFTLTQVQYSMDANRGLRPISFFSSTQKGAGFTGEFPIVLTWRNETDTQETETFSAFPTGTVNAPITYDCANYTVTGDIIANCSFSNLNWLRLLPGSNSIRVIGVAGVGQVRFKVRWQNIG